MKLWLLVALYFGCIGVVFLFARFDAFWWLTAGQAEGASPTIVKFGQAAYTVMLFLVPCIIFANAVLPQGLGYYKLRKPVKPIAVILGVLAMLFSVFFIDLVYTWNKSLVTDPEVLRQIAENDAASDWMMQMPGISDLLLGLLINALVPAIAEELFFRGGIQQLLGEWIKKPHVAIFLSAAFFSFLHLDPTGFIARFVLGLFLGYMFYWSGSLKLSIAAHFAWNAFAVLNSYAVQHYPQSWWVQSETTYTLAAISLVIGVGTLLTCRNLLIRKTT